MYLPLSLRALCHLPLLALIASTSLPPVAVAETALDMPSIEQAWQRGDYVSAREGLAHLAETEGTALAQYRYGRILYEGRGGPRDIPAAMDWLARAVAQDHLEAATLLARIHLSGDSLEVPRDAATAAKLLASAATRGDREAQYYLGLLTSTGDGVPKDEAAAVNWLLAAAEQDHVEAQYLLSRAYSRGAGVAENPEKTLQWLTRAAENGHPDAQLSLANAYDSGQGTEANPAEALRWYRRSAEAGNVLAQRMLGTKYMRGDGVEMNITEALRWLQPAAQAGDPGAMSNLGYVYATGPGGFPKDDNLALQWYAQAAERGLGRAMLVLARFHETGRGLPAADPARAVELYLKAQAAGEVKAAEQLVRLTLEGTAAHLAPHDAVRWMAPAAAEGNDAALSWLQTQSDANVRPAQHALALVWLARGEHTEDAVKLLTQAAERGDVRAQAKLGQLYTTGTGVALDYVQAHMWLNVAAASGAHDAAKERNVVAQLMTAEQVAEAQTAARLFFEAAQQQAPITEQTVTTSTGDDQ